MSIIYICYKTCHLETQTVAPTLHVLQSLNCSIKYTASQPHKPIIYPSYSYDGSNVKTQVEDFTTQK